MDEAEARAEQRAIEDVLYAEKVEMYKAMRAAIKSIADGNAANTEPLPKSPVEEPSTVGEQLERLRIEADITQERLADLIKIDIRNVQRHLAGTAVPTGRTIFRYQQQLSKLLKRHVVITKTP